MEIAKSFVNTSSNRARSGETRYTQQTRTLKLKNHIWIRFLLHAHPLSDSSYIITTLHLDTSRSREPTIDMAPNAIAKITGVKACQSIRKQYNKDYVSLMPTNLYGSFDNFDLQSSHVLPAMIRKFHEAKINKHSDVTLWGSGTPMREFLFVDDMAEATIFALENDLPEYL